MQVMSDALARIFTSSPRVTTTHVFYRYMLRPLSCCSSFGGMLAFGACHILLPHVFEINFTIFTQINTSDEKSSLLTAVVKEAQAVAAFELTPSE